MITNIEDYFTLGCGRCARFATADCSTRQWGAGQRELRRLCLEVGLVETVKWAHPCYMHRGRNIAVMGAFRDDLRLSFIDAALLTDPHGVLERQGPNTQHPDMIRFTDNAQVGERAAVVRAYLLEAMAHAEAGRRPPRDERALELPDALEEALGVDPELAAAFAALTPGRQRSWAIHVGGAKKPETRAARVAAARDRILEGKGALER